MYSVLVYVGLGLALIWLFWLTYLLLQEKSYLQRLFPQGKDGDIRKRLDEVVVALEETQRREQNLHKALRDFNIAGLGHIQRVETFKYNPYNDTGGDQSFSIVFLDGKRSGVLITSLHSRAGTRVYTKIINKGQSDLELSKEEKQILTQALT